MVLFRRQSSSKGDIEEINTIIKQADLIPGKFTISITPKGYDQEKTGNSLVGIDLCEKPTRKTDDFLPIKARKRKSLFDF